MEGRISAILERLLEPVEQHLEEQAEQVRVMRQNVGRIAKAASVRLGDTSPKSDIQRAPMHGSKRPVMLRKSKSINKIGNMSDGYNVGTSGSGKPLAWEQPSRMYSFDNQEPSRFGRLATDPSDESSGIPIYNNDKDSRGRSIGLSSPNQGHERRRRDKKRAPLPEKYGGSLTNQALTFEQSLCGKR